MSHVAMTGAGGFLGWHTSSALAIQSVDVRPVAVGDGFNEDLATPSIDGASRVIHIAGVNRGSDDEVRDGNILFARQLASVVRAVPTPPPLLVYSNSTQAGSDSPYGRAKDEASAILAEAARDVGARFVDLKLPNLFGEHGRPFYNSVVATFCSLLSTGGTPTVDVDRQLSLLHVQDAADLLTGVIDDATHLVVDLTVTEFLRRLESIAHDYGRGVWPSPGSRFDLNLLNTYRSFVMNKVGPAGGDLAGAAAKIIRPGATEVGIAQRRGFERIQVSSGEAHISVQRLVTGETVEVVLDGERGAVFDLPTLWNHTITNRRDDDLVLLSRSLAVPEGAQ